MSVFDKQKSRRSFDRASGQYDRHACLQQQVASTLLRHLEQHCVVSSPQSIVDLGCGTGQVTEAMCQRYPDASVVALDFSAGMLDQMQRRLGAKGLQSLSVCADAEQLPFKQASFDLVVSSLMLQWSNDLQATLADIYAILKSESILAFSSFSQGTLKEVKAAWEQVDGEAHSSDFLSLSDFEDRVLAAGYSNVDVIPQTIVIPYDSARNMLLEMKGIGASNARSDRLKGLTGKRRFEQFERAMEADRLPQGAYPCTWEVTYVFCSK